MPALSSFATDPLPGVHRTGKMYLEPLFRCSFGCRTCFHRRDLSRPDAVTAEQTEQELADFAGEYRLRQPKRRHHEPARAQVQPGRSPGTVASRRMERIAIIGCGGSGKTTTGRRLGQRLGVTPVHLDVLYYDGDWNTLPREKFAALQEELVAADTWIIDGNFASTLPVRLRRADTVIFLDLPAVTCLYGIAQRRIGRRLRGHDGQNDATGVYDRITWDFIRYVWGYRRSMGPRVRKLISEHARHADIKILTSRRAASAFLASLE